jgi:hypothetical protein
MNSNPAARQLPQSSIAPWFTVARDAKAIEFYKSAFGASEVYRYDSPTGGAVVRLSVNGAEFWVSEDPQKSPESTRQRLGGDSIRDHSHGRRSRRPVRSRSGGGCLRNLPASPRDTAGASAVSPILLVFTGSWAIRSRQSRRNAPSPVIYCIQRRLLCQRVRHRLHRKFARFSSKPTPSTTR